MPVLDNLCHVAPRPFRDRDPSLFVLEAFQWMASLLRCNKQVSHVCPAWNMCVFKCLWGHQVHKKFQDHYDETRWHSDFKFLLPLNYLDNHRLLHSNKEQLFYCKWKWRCGVHLGSRCHYQSSQNIVMPMILVALHWSIGVSVSCHFGSRCDKRFQGKKCSPLPT